MQIQHQAPRATVTVMMSTFNREAYLREAIDSILGQSVAVNQIIVVNDGSSDSTEEILRSYGQRVSFFTRNNSGKPASLNFALNYAVGDYLWIFDDDDVALDSAIDRLVRPILLSKTAPDFVYGSFLEGCSDETGRIKVLSKKVCPVVEPSKIFFKLLKANFLSNQAMLIRRQALIALGGFREGLSRSQDYDLNLRLARSFSGFGIPDEIFIRRTHSGDRGPKTDRFSVGLQEKKWYEYNKIIVGSILPTLTRAEISKGMAVSCDDDQLGGALDAALFSLYARRGMWRESMPFLRKSLQLGTSAKFRKTVELLFLESCNRSSVTDLRSDLYALFFILLKCATAPKYFGQFFIKSYLYSITEGKN